MPEKTIQKLDQEKVYQILSKGDVFTMEDDLREALQSQKIKTNLIPEQQEGPKPIEKKVETKSIFVEKAHFDPFKKLEPIKAPKASSISIQPQKVVAKIEPVEIGSAEQLFLKRKEILEKVKNQKVDLEIIFQKVEAIKEQKDQIERQEQEAKDSAQKHSFEEQRWKIEKKFKEQQDLQWAKEEEIEKLLLVLSKIDNDLRIIENKKAELAKKELENKKLLQNIELSRQKEDILNKGKEILKNVPLVEAQYSEFLAQKNKIEKDLLTITQEEQKIEEQSRDIEKRIKNAMDAGERRKLEQERREIETKRQIQEKKRWEAEKLQEAMKNNAGLKEKFFELKKEEQNINQKVAEIEAQLNTGIETRLVKEEVIVSLQQEEQDEEENEREKEIIEQIRFNAKEREQELIQKQFVQEQVVKEERAMDEEQSLRIQEENRQKAIEKLRQIAEQEQKKLFTGKLKGPLLKEEILKKLTKVSPEEEAQRKDFLSRISQKAKLSPRQNLKSFEEGVVFHPMIRKISLFEKVAVRALIIFAIIGIIAGIYFLITELMKKQSVSENSTVNASSATQLSTSTSPVPQATTTEQPTPTEQPLNNSTIVIPPASLILVSKNNIFSYQNYFQSIALSLKTILENKNQYNSFEQISIFDENQQAFLSAGQFFSMMGATLPQEINQENGTSTALIFSSKFGNRLGFILQTENPASLQPTFLSWENQAEANTIPTFDLMGKTSPALQKSFIDLKYKTVSIRCQMFTNADLGICYAIYKRYFIWTSSLEQMQRIVDKLL